MTTIITDWVHVPGKHCGSTALRDISHFYGHKFSEGLCFGLGCGIGVAYLHADFINPTRIVHLRTMTLEPDFFLTLNIPFSWKQETNSQRALDDAKRSIDAGVPVLVRTDIFHVKYYNSSTHFPGHIIIMWGYDDEKKEVFLSDTHFEGLMTLSYEDFMKARRAGPPIPLENDWCAVKFISGSAPLEHAMRAAIKKSSSEMLDSQEYPIGKKGVDAIKAVAEELESWKNAEDAAWCFRFTYQIIEKRGTGGGGFRRLYAEFLSDAEQKLPELQGENFPQRMTSIADLWTAVSEDMRLISENLQDASLFKNASEKLMLLYENEKSFFSDILQIIDNKA